MGATEIKAKLERLGDMRARLDVINLRFDQKRLELLPPELRFELDELETERQAALDKASEGIQGLEKSIKELVKQHGATVKGSGLQAVWVKPRVSWDSKALEGNLIDHPELKKFRKIGNPSCRIMRLK